MHSLLKRAFDRTIDRSLFGNQKSSMLKAEISTQRSGEKTQTKNCPKSTACLTLCPDCPELGGLL